MTDWEFKRDISNDLVDQLNALKVQGNGWWYDIINDEDLIIALRGDYLNVYYLGQSLFKISMGKNSWNATTHPKYLVDPSSKGEVKFDGENFEKKPKKLKIIESWESNTLKLMKAAAKTYSGQEKQGCHKATVKDPNLIDVEIVFSQNKSEKGETLPRIDLLLLAENGDKAQLKFWEAKCYGSKELGSMGKPQDDIGEIKVIKQINKYIEAIELQKDALEQSYTKVCKQLVSLYEGTPKYPDNSLIARVAREEIMLSIGESPNVGLFVFGFSQIQKTGSAEAFAKLEEYLVNQNCGFKALGKVSKGALS